ncbi:MAG: TusE/DsrC/DsvC family sulfur relay protein [Candidatus Kapabacteria bacterium]|nr:TusE/DsrC/DsvC family sulfur relay protein [Candidatus Kapabacteria bacterium]
MHLQQQNETELELDAFGYLSEPKQWNQQYAEALAQQENINELTLEHWRIINYIRNFYFKNNRVPKLAKLLRDNKYSLKEIYILFPSGPVKGALKIAGIPRQCLCE